MLRDQHTGKEYTKQQAVSLEFYTRQNVSNDKTEQYDKEYGKDRCSRAVPDRLTQMIVCVAQNIDKIVQCRGLYNPDDIRIKLSFLFQCGV